LDRSLRKLIDVVPFGVQECAALNANRFGNIKGGHRRTDRARRLCFIIVGGGGIWDWFDIHSQSFMLWMASQKRRCRGLRLFFMGLKITQTLKFPSCPWQGRTQALAEQLGLLNKHGLFFSDEWVTYDNRSQFS